MNNPGLIKAFVVVAVVAAFRIVKFGADDHHVLASALGTDAHIGVTGAVVPNAAESPIDITMTGIAEVEFGGVVTRGDLLTSDALGRAIVAAPALGANVRIVGQAMSSGVLGDIGSVHLQASQIKG